MWKPSFIGFAVAAALAAALHVAPYFPIAADPEVQAVSSKAAEEGALARTPAPAGAPGFARGAASTAKARPMTERGMPLPTLLFIVERPGARNPPAR